MRAYRLITKIKNNRLWESIVEAYPFVRNQSQAAKVLKVNQSTIGNLLNMKEWPYGTKHGWTPTAIHLGKMLGQSPEFLFDPALYGMPPLVTEVTMTIDRPMLPDSFMLMLPESAPDMVFDHRDREHAITNALDLLTTTQAEVVKLRFGLGGYDEHTLAEVGAKLNISPERARQIESRALRLLRNPMQADNLRPHQDR